MTNASALSNQSRRQFITRILPACAFSCLTLSNLLAVQRSGSKSQEAPEEHKFQQEWGHTYEEAFHWKYGFYIEIMEGFAETLGRGPLIEMIKRSVDESYQRGAENDPNFSFTEWTRGGSIYQNMMTRDILERTERAYEIRVSECLWAKAFQDRDAADIGYATVCHGDFADARAAHPNVKLERTRTIMEGHGYCNHRWTWEG